VEKSKGEIMTHLKEFVHQYNIGDVVYVVNQYQVEKVVIEAVLIKISKEGYFTNYSVVAYRDKDKADRKARTVGQAYVVNNLLTAVTSAKMNNEQIYNKIKIVLDSISDQAFEPVERNDEQTN
jgi:hypothetical protein